MIQSVKCYQAGKTEGQCLVIYIRSDKSIKKNIEKTSKNFSIVPTLLYYIQDRTKGDKGETYQKFQATDNILFIHR